MRHSADLAVMHGNENIMIDSEDIIVVMHGTEPDTLLRPVGGKRGRHLHYKGGPTGT